MSIKHSISYIENSRAKITLSISKKEAETGYDTIVAKYSKDAVLPGFRKGKVPKEVLIKKYGDGLKAEAIDEIIQQAIKEVFPTLERKALPYAQPTLDGEPNLDFSKDLEFTIIVDVEPEFTLSEYKNVEIESYEIIVSEKDITKELERLQEQNTLVTAKKGAIALGDLVTANFVELDDKGNENKDTARENFTFTAGEGKTYHKFDSDVVGMSVNDSKIIEKEFAKDVEEKDLAGRKIALKVTITAVKEKTVPKLDDEFAVDVSEKFKTLQDLKDDISTRLKENASSSAKNRQINDIIKSLVAKTTIEVPQSMIKAESDMRFSNFARQSGLAEDQLAKMLGGNKESLSPNWMSECEESVKGRLILTKIQKTEKIEATEDEIKVKMDKMAEEYKMSVADMQKQFGSQFNFYVANEIEDEKVHTYLIESAKITKTNKVSIEEFMQTANS